MRKLFDDIEGIKPDNEQRLLAIEVSQSDYFIEKKLKLKKCTQFILNLLLMEVLKALDFNSK